MKSGRQHGVGPNRMLAAAAFLVAVNALQITSFAFQADSGPDSGSVTFPFSERTLWLAASSVIPFEVAHPGPAAFHPELSVDTSFLEVLRRPEALARERIGYLRVLAKELGSTTIRLADTSLVIHVRESPSAPELSLPELRITNPIDGALLWGTVHIGVELRGLLLRGVPAGGRLRLELSSGQILAPIHRPSSSGPDRRASFELDTSELQMGPLSLRAVFSSEDGERVESPTVRAEVVSADEQNLLVAECEELIGGDIPKGFAQGRATLGRLAGGGAYTVHSRANHPLVAPIRINDPGRYQLIVIARGDMAAGSFPSIGFAIDSSKKLLTTGHVFDRNWRRLAVGHSVWLDAGEHDFGLLFLNDRSIVDTNDRNLYLDRFELMRADGASGADAMELATQALEAGFRDAAGDNEQPRFESRGLSIALDRPIDGATITGRVQLPAVCRWDETRSDVLGQVPKTSLVLNGEVVLTQMAARPHFALDRANFQEGANQLYLRARRADGREATTPVQTVYVERRVARQVRDAHYFEVLDERWSDSMESVLTPGPGNQRIAKLPPVSDAGAEELRLQLPDELHGRFKALFRTRGARKPEPQLAFHIEYERSHGTTDAKPKTIKIKPYWSLADGGVVKLKRGRKTLVLERTDRGKKRDLQLLAAVLRRVGKGPDMEPPVARMLYPSAGHKADEIDVCIVEGWDDDALSRADVWIDGRPQGTFGYVPEGAGYVVLPFFTADLGAGEHTLRCRLQDPKGNLVETGEVTIRVGLRDKPGPYARAIHLLNRFGYGPDPVELAKCLLLGEEAWLRRSLGSFGIGERTALGAAEARLVGDSVGSVSRAALTQALRTDNPVRTRFCFWVENHFSTWINKTRGPAKWNEHKRFLALGAAPFVELLWASATSPAMIHYLDQSRSYGSRLNENYAREILELHSLGVDGGYGQGDVTKLASVLAGLTLAEEARLTGEGGRVRDAMHSVLRFDPSLGDARTREVLGMRFEEVSANERFDRVRLTVELLAAHPSTARFIASSLLEHYVAAPAPEEMIEDLSAVFSTSGGDMREVLLALARHPGFWNDIQPRVATPFDYAMRLAHTADVVDVDGSLHKFLERSGMGVFRRETPDGYPEEDVAWVDANAVIQRRTIVDELSSSVRRLIPGALMRTPIGDPREWHERMIDMAAVRLLGWTLSADSRAAALAFCDSIEEPKNIPRELPLFIAQLPEANAR